MTIQQQPAKLKTFVVELLPKTRVSKDPIIITVKREFAVDALNQAMREVGFTDEKDYKKLEMVEEITPTYQKIAYFNTTRNFSTDYLVGMSSNVVPINQGRARLVRPGTYPKQETVVNEVLKAIMEDPANSATKEDDDDYKESKWYEVDKD